MNEPMDEGTQLQSVRAKMVCNELRTSVHGNNYTQHRVEFGAVCGETGDDKLYSDATPGGACWLNISKGRPAINFFKPGKRYYVTFSEAD